LNEFEGGQAAVDLKGKAAIVTGSTTGIGRAIALRLAADGADVALNNIVEEGAQDTLREIKALGVHAVFIQADVGDAEQAKALVEKAIAEFGHVDILVNNAGIARDNMMPMMSEEDFDRVIRVNLKSCFNMTKSVYRPMMKQRSGAIVNISSVVGMHGNAGQANYAASKAGVIGITLSVAKELGGRGVRVNAVAPGYIQTAMTAALPEEVRAGMLARIPLNRLGTPEDIAGVVAFLCSDAAAYITGQVIPVDGGMQ
jgi:3-oxoacyl-[acyl-carrier protein] reductase